MSRRNERINTDLKDNSDSVDLLASFSDSLISYVPFSNIEKYNGNYAYVVCLLSI